MFLRELILLTLCFSLYGCSDYQTGYRDGYAAHDKNEWIVFGRDRYFKGYHSGQAEKFQQEWVIENPVKENLLHCPTIMVRTDPLMFLPPEYKRIAQDIYQIEE